MKELTEEQKNLADQMIEDIHAEIKAEQLEQNPLTGEGEVTPVEVRPNALVDGILEWGNQLDFSAVNENSVLLIKVNVEDPQYAQYFQMGVVRHVLEPRFELLKKKKVTVLFTSHTDDLSILTEADMNKSGWVKKDASRIITL